MGKNTMEKKVKEVDVGTAPPTRARAATAARAAAAAAAAAAAKSVATAR